MQNGYFYKKFELIGYPITATIYDDGEVQIYYRDERCIGKIGFNGRYLRNMDECDNKYYDEIFSELSVSIKFLSILNDFLSILSKDCNLIQNLIVVLNNE